MYRHQVDNHKNLIHALISLDRTQLTKFLADRIFDWYFDVSEVNTYLESDHSQNDGLVQPIVDFQRILEIECLDNKTAVELGDNGKPKRTCKIPLAVSCENITVKHHGRMWDTREKRSAIRTIKNGTKIPGPVVSVPRVYYLALDALLIIKLRG